MRKQDVDRILAETAYVRTGGSPEELQCAKYIQAECAKMGLTAAVESFSVDMAQIETAFLTADGNLIPCKGYLNAGCADVEAPLYYLRENTPYALSGCKDKIVLLDGYMGYWKYQDIVDNGAVGFITYDGHVNFPDRDMDQRELRSYVSKGRKIPGVNINAKDAVKLIADGVTNVHIRLQRTETQGLSHNVILDLPGQREEYIVLTAHYDSTSLSQGAYDNMSGSIGLLGIAEYFAQHPHSYGLRFIWCGSEERGLLGSKAYCATHEEEMKNIVLNINLDMIGCIMGKFIACCTSEENLVSYLKYFSLEQGFGCSARQDVYSSDSTPFADKGVPALSFARIAPPSTGTIHNSYDTAALMSSGQALEDIDFIIRFTERMANAVCCPVGRTIPDNMKEKLDEYLSRKRPKDI